MTRRVLKKGYTGQWSEELFVVLEKIRTIPTTYRLKDLVGTSGTRQDLYSGTCIKEEKT